MMRTTPGSSANPEIQRVIEALLREDTNFDRTENRSAHRDHLVRPVIINLREGDAAITAFSRNVSASGIGLITDTPIDDRTVADLEIIKLEGSSETIIAECRWSKVYGLNWHLSGWQFINLKRK